MTEGPIYAADRPRRVQRPGGRRAPATAAASCSRRSTASPTGPCGCPTACTGTCRSCSPRRWTASARPPPGGRSPGSASTPGASTTRCSTGPGACSGCRSTTATRAPRGWTRGPSTACPPTSSTRRPASRRCRSTPSSSCSPTRARRASRPPSGSRSCPTCRATGSAASSPTSRTCASTSGLLDARTGRWARRPRRASRTARAARSPRWSSPASALGPLLAGHAAGLGLPGRPGGGRRGHDTASAFAGAPVVDEHAAVLSSGTWSLLGLELPGPVLSDAAREANLTNERGVDGTTRLLKNVMGLWLVQECRRVWGAERSFDELAQLAEAHRGEVPLFDPDDRASCGPGDMPELISAIARPLAGSGRPRGRGARASSSRWPASTAGCWSGWSTVAGVEVRRVHVIGGGARNAAALRADRRPHGPPVLAGPVEATALGNVLVQMRASGRARRARRCGPSPVHPPIRSSTRPPPTAPAPRRPTAASWTSAACARPPPSTTWRRDRHERRLRPADRVAAGARHRRPRSRARPRLPRGRDPLLGLRRLGYPVRRLPPGRPARATCGSASTTRRRCTG